MIYLLLAACLISACTTLPKAIEPVRTARPCPANNEIFITNHGWHTGVVLKAEDMNNIIPALKVRFQNVKYYEIGWGDAGFYQSNEITTGLTFRAMFWSSGSVLHIYGFNAEPSLNFPGSDIRQVKLSSDSYQTLLKFIHSSFMKNESGEVISLKHGVYGDSQFYTGFGNYHIFNTCNKWTAKALYSAGLDIDTSLKLTAESIMNFLENNLDAEIGSSKLSNCILGNNEL